VFEAKCDCCGRFMKCADGASWAEIYDMVGMGLDHEILRCAECTQRLGPAESNARPYDGNMTPYQGVWS